MLAKKRTEAAKLDLGDRDIEYKIKYSKRRTMEVRITASGQVVVSAPLSVRPHRIEQFLSQRTKWIEEKLNNRKDDIRIIQPEKIENGTEVYFLGKKYEAAIRKDILSEVSVEGDKIIIARPTLNEAKILAQLKEWFKQQCELVFGERLEHCLKLSRNIGVDKARKIIFRKMQSRWGTCTGKNQIILNSNLIFLDVEYIDYVILHELCHFKQKNHGPKYYALLQALSPNYRDIRKRLNKHYIG